MEDDSYFMPENEFETQMRNEKGFPFFRRYRVKLVEDQKKEKEMMERGEYITVKEV